MSFISCVENMKQEQLQVTELQQNGKDRMKLRSRKEYLIHPSGYFQFLSGISGKTRFRQYEK